MSTMIREFYYSQLKQCFLAFQLTSQLCPILLLFPFAGSKVLLCDSSGKLLMLLPPLTLLLLLRIFRTANSGMIMKSLESGLGKSGYLTLR